MCGAWARNSPAADIGGGHRAGIHTIWVRERPWPDGFTPPHHTVDGVTGAVSYLLGEGRGHREDGRRHEQR
ncbi:hypothetical protein PV703_05630 [Streptomyces sp. ME01-24h]|nr:hypothetical protein [Streptomyces sp. ME01-24h]